VRKQGWGEAFVFFKHEDAGAGPKLAGQFAELDSQRAPVRVTKSRAKRKSA